MKKNHTIKGSITVFLSMILLIIISLIMTTVEALRAYSMSVYSQRSLYTAVDSVLADYYYPLFKEYHVFGLDGAYGSHQIQEEKIEDKINEYMEYSFDPGKNISFGAYNIPVESFDIHKLKTEDVKLEDFKTLMDYNGELFTKQAVEYTKFSLAGDGASGFLEKLDVIKDSGIEDMFTLQPILNEKIKVEEEVSIITDDMINLSKLLDGIIITNSGPKTNSDGSLYIDNNFVKKLCNSPSTMNNPNTDNSWVSSSLMGKYINPETLVNESIGYLDLLIENKEIGGEIGEEIREEDQEEVQEDVLLREFETSISNIKEQTNNILPTIQEALILIDRLSANQTKVTKAIEDYESIIISKKNLISKDLYSSLWGDYKELEKYKDNNSNSNNSYDFNAMKLTLEENQNILNEVKDNIDIKITSSNDSWLEAKEKLNNISLSLSKYSHEGLQLDYSKLAKSDENMDIFAGINILISEGFMDLILPEGSSISSKSIEHTIKNSLPSHRHKGMDNDSDSIQNNLQTLNFSNSFEIFTDVLENFAESFDGKDFVVSTSDDIGTMVLYQKYILDHFASFTEDTKVEMPTALDYETEYILKGKDSDLDNLTYVIYDLLVFRTLMNVVSLFTNTTSNEQAGGVAASLVGFLGQPILITVTKTMIIFIWALAESIIDMSGLLAGKNIFIYKQFEDFELQLRELPYINKAYIRQKVDNIGENTSNVALSYNDYLYVLLLMKNRELKTFRPLDLIQINLQNNYEESFLINNCVYGIQVSAGFSMEQRFVSLPFIKNSLNLSDKVYKHDTIIEYSY